jgi:hypothetical protein
MESLFSKDPTARPPLPPYSIERIAQEIEHLRKRTSARYAHGEKPTTMRLFAAIALCSLLSLYFMDPFLYAFHRGDAIKAYLYLHNYGSDEKAKALVVSHILSENEATVLNGEHGAFQDYFNSPQQAEKTAESIVAYTNGLVYLNTGQYERLDPVGKLRYLLFYRTGFLPPVQWSGLNPSVIHE